MDLMQYSDKKVIVTKRADDAFVEIEGKVIAANPETGLLVKPVGKVSAELIRTHEIEKVDLAPTTLRIFKQKVLRPVQLDTVRQHLLEKHGLGLALVNSADEKKAMEIHNAIDHSDLSHTHGETKSED